MADYTRLICEIIVCDTENDCGAVCRMLRSRIRLEGSSIGRDVVCTFFGTVAERMGMGLLDQDEIGLGLYQADAVRALYAAAMAEDEDVLRPFRVAICEFAPDDGRWVIHAIKALRDEITSEKGEANER